MGLQAHIKNTQVDIKNPVRNTILGPQAQY